MFRLKDKREDKSFDKGLVELKTLEVGDFFIQYNCYCVVVNKFSDPYNIEIMTFEDKTKPRRVVLLGTARVKKLNNITIKVKDNVE